MKKVLLFFLSIPFLLLLAMMFLCLTNPIKRGIKWKNQLSAKFENLAQKHGVEFPSRWRSTGSNSDSSSEILWVVDDSETGFWDAWLRCFVLSKGEVVAEYRFRYDGGVFYAETEQTYSSFPFLERGWSLPNKNSPLQAPSPSDMKLAPNVVSESRKILLCQSDALADTAADAATQKNAAANELFSLSELPDGVVSDLVRMSASPDEDDVWRDYCLQFLGSALERTHGVTDADRALARETLVEALASTNATFSGTALRALHRAAPADPLVASNAFRIARDPAYPAPSRTTALLVLEECTSLGADDSAAPPDDRQTLLRQTAAALSADPSASPLLRQTAEAVRQRLASEPPNP